MNRRDTLLALLALGATGHAPDALAQAHRRIGYLTPGNKESAQPALDAFIAGLRDHGHVIGRDVIVDVRYAMGDSGRYPALADELIALRPDVLVAIEGPARVLRAKTSSIPIVLLTSSNLVTDGLAESFARPGGNVTGLSTSYDATFAKQVEFLLELSPKMARVALLLYEGLPAVLRNSFERTFRQIAQTKRFTPLVIPIALDSELVRAFEDIKKSRAEGLVVGPSNLTYRLARDIAARAQQLKIPTVSGADITEAESGILMTYSANAIAHIRYAARYVDRILKGAKPADLPIEQYGRFEFIVNLKTAKAIGIKVPQSLLVRADRVIE